MKYFATHHLVYWYIIEFQEDESGEPDFLRGKKYWRGEVQIAPNCDWLAYNRRKSPRDKDVIVKYGVEGRAELPPYYHREIGYWIPEDKIDECMAELKQN